MDGQEYLNQISASNRPVKSTGKMGGLLGSKFFIVGAIGLILLIVIIILGAILGGGKGGEQDLSYALKLHVENTAAVIQEYQPNVKSSELRSYSASLYSILSNTDNGLTEYLDQKYNIKDKDIKSNIVEEATLEKDGLTADLFEAKINGVLDRIYAHKMAYEISLITAEEASLVKITKDEGYKAILTDSYNSLTTLYEKFNNFSETN